MIYRVLITKPAERAMRDQALYIAVDQQSPQNAATWLENILTAADSLEQWPKRCSLADENEFRPYEIRKIIVGNHLLLFTVVEETKTVWVLRCRHGNQLPLLDDLPEDTPTE